MIDKIFDEITKAKHVLLISHVNPDGDTLGSMCAMKLFLQDKADMLIQIDRGKTYPETYRFLPHIDEAKTLENIDNIYDLIVTVDIAAIDRIVGKARQLFDSAKMTINIDHHKTNKGFAKINYIKGESSSTGEVLYDIFKEKNVQITKEMADCLYVAILTDTGGFRYENTTAKTLQYAADLVRIGVNNAEIAKKCYDFKPKAMVMFQSHIISNTKFICGDRVAYTIVTDSDIKKFNAKSEYTEGIAETLRSIDGVEISAVLKESSDQTTKVSIRSKNFDITSVVERFNGGGHIHAAGCTIQKPTSIAVDLLLNEIKSCLN